MDATGSRTGIPSLRGRRVALVPLAAGHGAGLAAVSRDGRLHEAWYTNVPAPDAVERYIDKALAERTAGRSLPFAVLDPHGEVVGSTRFYDLDASVPTVKIGYTWYAPRVQRTGLNTEAKLLMLEHAFGVMGCASVFFETSWFNHASRTAIARLGARQDGVLRNHKRHADGSLRDTVVFSLTDGEWPAARRHLQFKLDAHP